MMNDYDDYDDGGDNDDDDDDDDDDGCNNNDDDEVDWLAWFSAKAVNSPLPNSPLQVPTKMFFYFNPVPDHDDDHAHGHDLDDLILPISVPTDMLLYLIETKT